MRIPYESHVGEKYNKLLIIGFQKGKKNSYFLCRCDCGIEKTIRCDHVLSNIQKSCGCEKNKIRFTDLSGQKYGLLTVISLNRKEGNRIYWNCKCDCGNSTIVLGNNLTRKNGTKSCGCYQKEMCKKANTKHGKTKTRIFIIWEGMKARCLNPKSARYKRYGARGIKICNDWLDFEKFQKWALNSGYNDRLSIDRIDNNKGYYPENCRWATPKEQAQNRSSNTYVYFKGKKICITELSRILNIPLTTLNRKMSGGKK